MDQSSIYLFVYGTLLDENNSFAAYLREHAAFYYPGKVKGQLYDIGEYPGAVFDDDAKEFVYGSIYTMNNTAELFQQLDDYEGFGETLGQPNEFERELIVVETEQGLIDCWVYLYNLPVDGFRRITSGRYLE
jgi:gamma-glutamylcyclotransferase (GGCT)/AIG2-like uncharacterized protein YtfP